jgi:hypothetical protein
MTGAAPSHPDGWPDPHDRTCDDCGHVWFAGERRHEYADPAAARPEDSDVVCVLCRQKRVSPTSS